MYTLDGSDPTPSYGLTYDLVAGTPIHITATTTVKAIAFKLEMLQSQVAVGTYTQDAFQQFVTVANPGNAGEPSGASAGGQRAQPHLRSRSTTSTKSGSTR